MMAERQRRRKNVSVRTISRDPQQYTRSRQGDVYRVFRNAAPALHPFERGREYTRALNATKLDHVFAKPFVAQMEGHRDAVQCLARVQLSAVRLLSGACDGELRLWNVGLRRCLWRAQAHEGFVRGIVSSPDGRHAYSCGDDASIKVWRINAHKLRAGGGKKRNATTTAAAVMAASDTGAESPDESSDEDAVPTVDQQLGASHGSGSVGAADIASTNSQLQLQDTSVDPVQSYLASSGLYDIDHHREKELFATGSDRVDLWDVVRREPLHSFKWGCDTVRSLKFNQVEVNVLASNGNDRSIVLYDVRQRKALKKMVMEMATNCLAWNPMEAFNFTTANEDHHCYTFDMRNLSCAMRVHKGHTSAVMSVDYSPTGTEFVTGSYDRTVRIFPVFESSSRAAYHSQRMQRVFCVKWTLDDRYVLTGSDDMSVRLWRARAAQRMHTLMPREQTRQNYEDALKKRFGHVDEIKRIAKATRTPVPKAVRNAQRTQRISDQASKKRERNRRMNSKPGEVPYVSVKRAKIVQEYE